MIWNDESGTQPKHHAGKPQGTPSNGCLKAALIVALIVVAMLLVKAAGG